MVRKMGRLLSLQKTFELDSITCGPTPDRYLNRPTESFCGAREKSGALIASTLKCKLKTVKTKATEKFLTFVQMPYSQVPNKRGRGPNNQGGWTNFQNLMNRGGGRNSRNGLKWLQSNGKNKNRLSQKVKLKHTQKHVSLP